MRILRVRVVSLGLVLLITYSLAVQVRADRLPIKTYTTADGLTHNEINRIVRDSRGFLWFCTDEGLSRFDGYTFTNYTAAHGLPSPVRDICETHSGSYWIATGQGLYKFNPRGRLPRLSSASPDIEPSTKGSPLKTEDEMFVLCQPNDQSSTGPVNVLLEDHAGTVWFGAGSGVFRLEQVDGPTKFRTIDIGLARVVRNDSIVRALVEDHLGALWIGAGSGLYRRWPDGRIENYTTEQGLPANEVRALLLDSDGQLWVGTRQGLCQIELESEGRARVLRVYTTRDKFPSTNTRSLFQSSNGQLWVGLSTALVELIPPPTRDRSRAHYVRDLGIKTLFAQALTEDRDGNLWVGTDNGALKLERNGFTTYTEEDGLGEARVSSLFETRSGDLCTMTLFSTETPLSWFDGKRFNAIRPRVPRQINYFGWGWHQLTLEDQAGEWWLPTGQGLIRYPKVSHVSQLASTLPKAIYTTKDGLGSNDVFRLFEDSRGDIWIATFSEARGGITRWERTTEAFHSYGAADGLPQSMPVAHCFAEDRVGNLWVGLDNGDLARFSNGHFTLFTSEHGLPSGPIYRLYLDHTGRLWIASATGGLLRSDDPGGAEQPRFTRYTTAQGLSSNSVNCITEDRYGRIYAGNGHGVDRLDPSSGRVKPFTSSDGLIPGEVRVSFCDRKGDLWFGGKSGVSRFSPQQEQRQPPTAVLITSLRIAGETHLISALGESEVALADLGPDQNQIQVDFVAFGFSPGEGLRYQYHLEGSRDDWSALSQNRTVNFANLAPGRYCFQVRAENADGEASERPASFSFRILPPIWQRWWFLTLAALITGIAGYGLYRYRLTQLLKLERVRTRIASDLHDDIGANLTRIAILSEVAHSRMISHSSSDFENNGSEPGEQNRDSLDEITGTEAPLTSIARISRESIASMSDIVWAINPKRDQLIDLVQRMRKLATEVFTGRNIEFEFRAPESEDGIKLGADLRRDVLLIFKEVVNNAARHSGCTSVDIELRAQRSSLLLIIRDNGKGFDPATPTEGNGIGNIRRRATALGAQLQLNSAEDKGAEIVLKVPY